MKLKFPTLAPVVIFGLVWMLFGINHLVNADLIRVMIPPVVPGGTFWIYATGIFMILAGIAIITGIWGRPACYLLAFMLLLFIAMIHVPGLTTGNIMSPFNVLKDLGLLAACIVVGKIRPHIRQISDL